MKSIDEIVKWLGREDNRKFHDEGHYFDYTLNYVSMFARNLASLIIKFNEENKLSDEDIEKNAD